VGCEPSLRFRHSTLVESEKRERMQKVTDFEVIGPVRLSLLNGLLCGVNALQGQVGAQTYEDATLSYPRLSGTNGSLGRTHSGLGQYEKAVADIGHGHRPEHLGRILRL
jgi:hypothetical protein